jgi:hypothetical protein
MCRSFEGHAQAAAGLGEYIMWDIGMAAVGVAFFAIAILYVKGCNLLAKKEPVK